MATPVLPVVEIFESLQGEGALAGTPALFIRAGGCNLRCPFCDTDFSHPTPTPESEILGRAAVTRMPLIVLTGGEPTLTFSSDFVARLHTAAPHARIAIETNGTRPLPAGLDHVAVSPKQAPDGTIYPIAADRADELKVVFTGQSLEPYFLLPCCGPDTRFFLQPCWVPDRAACAEGISATVAAVLADPRWRLSLQQHRYLGIR